MNDSHSLEKLESFEPLLCFVNGKLQSSISVADRGLAFGDGVFETILLSKSKLVLYELHLKRLIVGLEKLHITIDLKNLQQQIDYLINGAASQNISDAIVKLIVTRGEGRGYTPNQLSEPNIVLAIYPKGDWSHQAQHGVSTMICSTRLASQPMLAGVKHLNRIENVIASIEVKENKLEEGLVLDQNNKLIEGISRNIFIVFNKKLHTPLIENSGIKGVMRDYLMKSLAPKLDYSVIETDLNVSDLTKADEVFLCNSVSGIWPVISVDTIKFKIGEITKSLQFALANDFSMGKA